MHYKKNITHIGRKEQKSHKCSESYVHVIVKKEKYCYSKQ